MSNDQKNNGASSMDVVKSAMSKATIQGTMAGLKQTDVNTILKSMLPQIAQALPKHLTAERMCQMTTTLITQNQEIAKCSIQSIVGAIMQASILGFEPVSALGQCYFVPFAGHVQFQIGYKGYLRLAQNSKEIKNIYAEVVRTGDIFEYELGLEPKLKHVPNMESEGQVTHVYAVAHLINGGYQFVVLSRKQVESLRLRSHNQKNGLKGAWLTDYEAMAKGKAIKQLSKYLPLSVDVQKAIMTDESIITDKAFTNNNSGINIEAISFDNYEDISPEKPIKESKQEVPKATKEENPLGEKVHFLDDEPEVKKAKSNKIEPNLKAQPISVNLFDEKGGQ